MSGSQDANSNREAVAKCTILQDVVTMAMISVIIFGRNLPFCGSPFGIKIFR